MSFGIITSITKDQGGSYSGTLNDLDTQAKLSFKGETNLDGVNEPDVVNYTDLGQGMAGKLSPNLNVKKSDMSTASRETQGAFMNLLRAMAKDSNQTTVMAKKI